MANQHIQSKDDKSLDYFIIDDFSAGIQFEEYNVASLPTQVYQNQSTVIASDPSGTFGCYANPTHGGLSPLPGILALTALPATHTTSQNNVYIIACIDTSSFFVGAGYFAYLYQANATTNWFVDLWEFQVATTGVVTYTFVDQQQITTGTNPQGLPAFFSMTKTYLNISSALVPSLVFGGGTAVSTGFNTKYYNLASAAILGTMDTAVSIKLVFSHQGRVISIGPVTGTVSAAGFIEAINFTDPPQTLTMGTQQELFYPESPSSYGAWGSVSSSELLLIKSNNGGVVVSGDVFSPYITNVPSIPGTNGLFQKAALTPSGLCYLSNKMGCWSWNGGAQAQKLSIQLGDEFYNYSGTQVQSFNLTGIGGGFNNASITAWNDMLLVQDNWVYNFNNNSWWLLTPNPTNNVQYHNYCLYGGDGSKFIAFPDHFLTGTTEHPYLFDTDVHDSIIGVNWSWQWKSQPIIVSQGEIVDIDEIVIRTSVGTTVFQNTVTVTVSSTDPTVSPQSETFFVNDTGPGLFRMRLYVQSAAIIVTVSMVQNFGAGPISLNQIDIGYKTRWKVAIS